MSYAKCMQCDKIYDEIIEKKWSPWVMMKDLKKGINSK